jgi:hypothetical protein
MAKPRRKRPAMRKEDAPKLPKLAKKRRYRARWRPHEIVYW